MSLTIQINGHDTNIIVMTIKSLDKVTTNHLIAIDFDLFYLNTYKLAFFWKIDQNHMH